MIDGDALPPPGPALDRWIRARRGARNALDPERTYGAFVEEERAADGRLVAVATLFLTNRECPYTCLMCDLWVNTLATRTPAGAIPRQIERALAALPRAEQLKLYNAGSFFDRQAVPPGDRARVVELVQSFSRVIVEAHPALVGADCAELAEALGGRLEVAMGLETAHPEVLARLNKRMTLADIERAASRLAHAGVPWRAFVLIRPPYLTEEEGVIWAVRSVAAALAMGAACVALIPTRGGNGALEHLRARGLFEPPRLASVERALEESLELARGRAVRIFADTWDLQRLATCPECAPARQARLETINRTQRVPPPIRCRCTEL